MVVGIINVIVVIMIIRLRDQGILVGNIVLVVLGILIRMMFVFIVMLDVFLVIRVRIIVVLVRLLGRIKGLW